MSAAINKKTKNNLPKRGPGRPKGVSNKITVLLKDAIIRATEMTGNPDDAKQKGLVGYFRWLAKVEPKAHATLLGKILPTQITGEDGKAITINVDGKDASLL